MSWALLAAELSWLASMLAELQLTWELELLLPSGERVVVQARGIDSGARPADAPPP
jgi:hypothetical protein